MPPRARVPFNIELFYATFASWPQLFHAGGPPDYCTHIIAPPLYH